MFDKPCVICEAQFREEALVDGKCKMCRDLFPGINSRAELKLKQTPDKARTLTEDVVRLVVYEILEEAGIKRAKCEKCGSLFFKTSPAMKFCPKCREKETK